MAVATQTSCQIFLDEFRFATFATAVDQATVVTMKNATTFGSGGYSMFVAGLKMLNLNLTGLNDYAALSLDEWLRGNVGTTQVVSIGPGIEATGSTVVITQGIPDVASNFDAQVGDIPAVKFAVKPVGQVIAEGQVTQITSPTITANGFSTPVNIGNLGATQQASAAIHVISIAGTATPTLTAQIQSSTTSGGAYTNRGSAGAGITAIGGQFLRTGVLGAVAEGFWRISWTVSGTSPIFGVFASLAIS